MLRARFFPLWQRRNLLKTTKSCRTYQSAPQLQCTSGILVLRSAGQRWAPKPRLDKCFKHIYHCREKWVHVFLVSCFLFAGFLCGVCGVPVLLPALLFQSPVRVLAEIRPGLQPPSCRHVGGKHSHRSFWYIIISPQLKLFYLVSKTFLLQLNRNFFSVLLPRFSFHASFSLMTSWVPLLQRPN